MFEEQDGRFAVKNFTLYSTCLTMTMAVHVVPLCRFRILEVGNWSDGDITFDVISCLNVLDRCSQPITLLHSMLRVLRPVTGRVMVAVVIPFSPFVEIGWPPVFLYSVCQWLCVRDIAINCA